MKVKQKEAIITFDMLWWSVRTAWKFSKMSFIIWGIIATIGAIMPFIVLKLNRIIIDEIINNKDNDILILVIVFGITYFVQNLYFTITEYINSIMLSYFGPKMQKLIMENAKKLDLRTIEKSEYNLLYSKLKFNINRIAYFVVCIVGFIADFITLISLCILSISINIYYFIAVIIIILLQFLSSKSIILKNIKCWTEIENYIRNSDYFYNVLTNMEQLKEIRQLELMDYFTEKWNHNEIKVNNINIKVKQINAKKRIIIECISTFLSILILVQGVYLLTIKSISVGTFILLEQIAEYLLKYLNRLNRNYSNIINYVVELQTQRKLVALCDSSEKIDVLSHSKEEILEKSNFEILKLSNLFYRYGVDSPYILKNINLAIHKGEVIALLGENGSGKTTLIKVIMGLYNINQGSICFKGNDYKELTREYLNNKIGIVMQDFNIYMYAFRENIGISSYKNMNNDVLIWEAAEAGGSKDIIQEEGKSVLDKKLVKWFNDDAVDLSYGQYQRLAISRGLFINKEVLILDEPTAALDPMAELDQFTRIRNIAEGRTALLISHRIGFARLADRIIVMDDGKIIEDGSHEELMSKDGMYASMLKKQAKYYIN